MADTPPPLPLETPLTGPGALDEGRVCPPHAPLLWRTLAFLADAILLGMIGYLLTSRVFMPWLHPSEAAALEDWNRTMDEFVQGGLARILENRGDAVAVYGEVYRKSRDIPAAAQEAISFMGTSMMLVYWVGFSVMEIATGGASLGKKMCRLRVARFPHGEKPTVFDSIIRSCWKALAATAVSPFALIFAIVDAHWPLFNPLRRSLHDIFSRTLVLDARYDRPEDDRKPSRREED